MHGNLAIDICDGILLVNWIKGSNSFKYIFSVWVINAFALPKLPKGRRQLQKLPTYSVIFFTVTLFYFFLFFFIIFIYIYIYIYIYILKKKKLIGRLPYYLQPGRSLWYIMHLLAPVSKIIGATQRGILMKRSCFYQLFLHYFCQAYSELLAEVEHICVCTLPERRWLQSPG
jgi:hypothetical protein